MATLQELNDERDIKLVYCAYCDIIDAKDFDRLTEVFAHDAVQDYRSNLGPDGLMQGTGPLIAGAKTHMGEGSNCGATHHNVMNFRIHVSGDTATAKVHYYAVHVGARKYEGAIYSMWGEYDDQLVRTPQGWRVKNRMYRSFFTEGPCVTFMDG
ncbi:nuclear transport factor 2 family protein [Flavisphingomonas formosensis]|uniref:nuclear transport factor 2 family protein n=1 Tax=Flavisphingomonas formosensis TaxID=861534 RepID=UPI0012FA01F8|nr:nuclear transport factor 2 family protein [Sphingomonas formosensis]